MLETCFTDEQKLPLVVQPQRKRHSRDALNELAESHKDFFRARLLEHGAILFRGFEVTNHDQFRDFVGKFSGREFFNYAGGASPRSVVEKNVYNSTEYPPDLALELHNELSYSENFPQHLYFFCQTAPVQGGATTLGDSRRILEKIPPAVVKTFREKQVLYERHLSAEKGFGYSWQEAFETDDKTQVEEICRRTGTDYEWLGERLRLRQIRPATLTHPETREEVWFNQAHGFHTSALDAATLAAIRTADEKPRLNSYFGDGTPIKTSMLKDIREVLKSETIPHQWQTGDILILDNILTAHGRMPFAGARKIILAMT